MNPADLVRELRGAGEPLHMAAAEALTAALAQEDRLRARRSRTRQSVMRDSSRSSKQPAVAVVSSSDRSAPSRGI